MTGVSFILKIRPKRLIVINRINKLIFIFLHHSLPLNNLTLPTGGHTQLNKKNSMTLTVPKPISLTVAEEQE